MPTPRSSGRPYWLRLTIMGAELSAIAVVMSWLILGMGWVTGVIMGLGVGVATTGLGHALSVRTGHRDR